MNTKKIIMAGLPETGKTTFIAAMRHILFVNQLGQGLMLGALTGDDDEYLNEMCEPWMRCEPVQRTLLAKKAFENVAITVTDTIRCTTDILDIPDFSGENVDHHFEYRTWSKEFRERVADGTALMLFVSPERKNNRPKLIDNENSYTRALGGDIPTSKGELSTYHPRFTPDQVKLVDELQFFLRYSNWQWPIKLAVIISAWDKAVRGTRVTLPEEWLKKNMPLLFQFLKCNEDMFTPKIYGVSAQGGDYKKRNELINIEPHKRVWIQEGRERTNDITAPIRWLTE